jgi:hypothetical protein
MARESISQVGWYQFWRISNWEWQPFRNLRIVTKAGSWSIETFKSEWTIWGRCVHRFQLERHFDIQNSCGSIKMWWVDPSRVAGKSPQIVIHWREHWELESCGGIWYIQRYGVQDGGWIVWSLDRKTVLDRRSQYHNSSVLSFVEPIYTQAKGLDSCWVHDDENSGKIDFKKIWAMWSWSSRGVVDTAPLESKSQSRTVHPWKTGHAHWVKHCSARRRNREFEI